MNGLRRPLDQEQRATFTELFFDLVFVLVVTQLSSVLLDDVSVSGTAKTLFLLLVGWWAWLYTTWMTNWFDADAGPVRAVLFVGMLASMLGAIALPDAFGDRALLLVAGYVGMQSFRNGFMVLAVEENDPLRVPIIRIFVWNAWVGLIWLAGALLDGDARVSVWLVALVFDYAGPFAGHWTPGIGRSRPTDWQLEPSHFMERIKLFMLIALGESIVAAGAAASDLRLTTARVVALVVAFGITAALWWLYFDWHADRALEQLQVAGDERGRLGRDLSYLHIPMIAGIIVAAVANELVIVHPGDELHGGELLTLAGGPLLYLLGSIAFKVRVLGRLSRTRLAASAVILVAVLATNLPSLASWTIVFAVLTGLAVVEAAERELQPHPDPL
jgi:low temperature requirement protein LtrA